MTRHLIRATNTVGELLGLYAVILLLATLAVAATEGWALADAAWWAVVTATTTGYGDLAPATPLGRAVGAILMHVAVLLILPLMIGRVCSTLIEDRHRFTDDEQRQLLDDVAAIKAGKALQTWVIVNPHGQFLAWDSLGEVWVADVRDACHFGDSASARQCAQAHGDDLTVEETA